MDIFPMIISVLSLILSVAAIILSLHKSRYEDPLKDFVEAAQELVAEISLLRNRSQDSAISGGGLPADTAPSFESDEGAVRSEMAFNQGISNILTYGLDGRRSN